MSDSSASCCQELVGSGWATGAGRANASEADHTEQRSTGRRLTRDSAFPILAGLCAAGDLPLVKIENTGLKEKDIKHGVGAELRVHAGGWSGAATWQRRRIRGTVEVGPQEDANAPGRPARQQSADGKAPIGTLPLEELCTSFQQVLHDQREATLGPPQL